MKEENNASKVSRFRKELEGLLNCHSMENGCNTPDFILAEYLTNCLRAFDAAVERREQWYGRSECPVVDPPNAQGEARVDNATTPQDQTL